MKGFPWRLIIATAMLFPVFYFIHENPFDTTSFLTLDEKKLVSWQRARMQINPGRTEHLSAFRDMQRNSAPLSVNSCVLIGTPPTKTKLLTIGISLVRRPQGSYILDTLRSLFFASSSSEQKHILVLIHLADPDKNWFTQMVSDISTLFKPQIQAGQLVVINTPLKSYLPLRSLKQKLRSKQNMDSAFLMNFATNCSDYFLMMEDNVTCVPGFVTQIATIVSTWEHKFWVNLEFSPLGVTGKLFHTRDLPYVVRFLLLFYQHMPCDDLLSYFRDLLQPKPIHFSPALFQHMGSYSSFEGQFNNFNGKNIEFEENVTGPPNNPAATVSTSLNVTDDSVLMNAYSLDKKFLYIKEANAGSHLTVILDIPAVVFRVQVLTGSEQNKENYLQEGHVELGYATAKKINNCDDYVFLGMLVNGIMNKQVLSEESGRKVKCVRLLITATLPSGLIVRHINLWSK